MGDYPGLRQLIREAAEQMDDIADPRLVAARAVEAVPEEYLREELTRAAVALVRSEFHAERAEELAPSTNSPKHGKAARMRGHDWLRSRLFVDGSWKFLRDCTPPDMDWLANDRRRLADENLAAAARFESYAQAMRSAKVSTMAELPVGAVTPIEVAA